MTLNKSDFKICIVGLGYVGLPLAARFSAKEFDIIGFDTNQARVEELKNFNDRNNDIDKEKLETFSKNAKLTSNTSDIDGSNIFIITVPTPINNDKTPNLNPLKSVSHLIGKIIKKGSIVIYESTVYPGVTDDICTPILEKESNLIFNKDFSTGYSPERIVPGDKINTIEKIKKVVSASNEEALKIIADLYSIIIDAGIHMAPSIKVAEAAKITENIQRDVNIALINEMHQLYSSIGINTIDVIEAAATKWNFMKLTPGLVGGHCISIDPYYLIHKSKLSGFNPVIMKSARKVNDEMDRWVVADFYSFIEQNNIQLKSEEVTLLGYTFKENCSDTRNTRVKNILDLLIADNIKTGLWDPYLESSKLDELRKMGINVYEERPLNVNLIFVCVYHDEIKDFLKGFEGLIYDFKNTNQKIY
tara:strand:+ start:1155 stop:2408 length:1254 start_codon:yes stop_codon:yes gene_type:complete